MVLLNICNAINKALANHKLDHLCVQPIDLSPIANQNLVSLKDSSALFHHLQSLAKDRKTSSGAFFRFVEDADRLTEILTTRKFRIYNLNAQEENDFAEYTEMYRRLGHLVNEKIEEARQNTYVLCLAKEMHNERMWKEYTHNHGVCYRVKIHKKDNPPLQWNFKDIFYDSGYDLDFYHEARFRVQRFASYSLIPQISVLAHFYKRSKYRWENESRISIKDLPGGANEHNAIFSNTCRGNFDMQLQNDNHNYLLADLDNALFKMDIEEVYCERNIDAQKYSRLVTACAEHKIPLFYKE